MAVLFFPCANQALVFPNAASVIFRSRDNRVALVVKGAGKDLVLVTLTRVRTQALNFIATFGRPKPARLVTTGRDDLVALRVKRDLTNFVLVTLQDGRARPRENVVDSRHAICTCSCQLVTRLVETGVEHFIVVTAELFDALAGADVPQARRPVNAARQAIVTSEVELAARQLS